MIKIKKKMVTKEEIEITDILCNKCGKTCSTNHLKASHRNYDGLIETKVYGSYWSKKIGGGNSISFSLCELCLDKLLKTFKIKAEKKESN